MFGYSEIYLYKRGRKSARLFPLFIFKIMSRCNQETSQYVFLKCYYEKKNTGRYFDTLWSLGGRVAYSNSLLFGHWKTRSFSIFLNFILMSYNMLLYS